MSTPSSDHDQPRWLSQAEQQVWRDFLAATARLYDLLGRQLELEFGLNLASYEVLVRLSEREDRTIRMAELADSVVHSRSRMTHTINRMEQRGWVVREACPEDGRGVNCRMTDAGMAILVAAAPAHVTSVRQLLVDVADPADFAAVGRVMAAVNKQVQQLSTV